MFYLIRLIPEFVLRIQNGIYCPNERIFKSLETAWFQTVSIGNDFKVQLNLIKGISA
jgi:factor associated with neutral sphingomyelinase activation